MGTLFIILLTRNGKLENLFKDISKYNTYMTKYNCFDMFYYR